MSDPENPSSPEAKRDVALKRVRKFVATYVAKGKYRLYPEAEVVENVVQGLADNLTAHGRMYCPCADVEDSKTKGSAMVCPCTPHHVDIARQGYCDCALFASPAFVEAESVGKTKPETSEAVAEASETSDNKADEANETRASNT